MILLAAYDAGCPAGMAMEERLRRLLAGPLAHKDFLLRFYGKERLMSVAARTDWVEPDLRALRPSGSGAEGDPGA